MRIAVVGAGVGGLAAAALLARKGHEVCVFEKNGFIGGRCSSFTEDGFTYDLGVHLFALCEAGPHGKVASLLGSKLEFVHPDPAARILLGQAEFDLPLRFASSPVTIFRLFRAMGLRWRSLPGITRWTLATMRASPQQVGELDERPLKQYNHRFTGDEKFHHFMALFTMLYFGVPYEEASAGEYVESFRDMFTKSCYGYPRGGSIRIPQAFLDGLIRHGGRCLVGKRVNQILVENGRVRGVLADHTWPADLVVSNAGIEATVRLSGKQHFPEEYVKRAEALKVSASALTLKYALRKRIIPYPAVISLPEGLEVGEYFQKQDRGEVPESFPLFMPVPSNYDPELAPPGCQLVIAGVPAASNLQAKETVQRLAERVDTELRRGYPEIDRHLIWKKVTLAKDVANWSGRKHGDGIGIAQTYQQTGNNKPAQATPVKGLYLVGADAGGRGIGTEQAVDSAINLVETLNAQNRPEMERR